MVTNRKAIGIIPSAVTVIGLTIAPTPGFADRLAFNRSSYVSTPTPTATPQIQILATGDLNADGRIDLVVTNYYEHKVYVMLQSSTVRGTYLNGVAYGPVYQPVGVAVADVNHDGKPDVAVASTYAGTPIVSLFLNNGEGVLGTRRDLVFWGSPSFVQVADVDRDGHPDIVAMVGNTYGVRAGVGDGTFGPASYYTPYGPEGSQATKCTSPGPGFHLADANGDGFPDIVTVVQGEPTRDRVCALLGDGKGGFGATILSELGFPASHQTVAISDLNRDGKLDVIVPRYDEGGVRFSNVAVLLGNGDGSFGSAANYSMGDGPQSNSTAISDLDGDGKLDLAVGCGYGYKLSVFPGRGDGTFDGRIDFSCGSTPLLSAAALDVNGDGRNDVVTANAGNSASTNAGNVFVFINTNIVTFKPAAFRCTAGSINVRSGLGTGYAITGTLPYGAVYVANGRDLAGAWYRIWFNGKYGWCSARYLARTTGVTGSRVLVAGLNVRSGPGTAYGIIGKVHAPEIYINAGSATGWQKINWAGKSAWISSSSSHVARVSF